MSVILTLISGKGGSGKTTLGLSIAKLLSKCKKNVLFVDCDMSTHGATYFFESSITNENANNILSTTDLLGIPSDYVITLRNVSREAKPLKVWEHFDFIPSVKKIYNSHSDDSISEVNNINISNINDSLIKKYDIVIFDCQAGYSNLSRNLIDISDVCLFVLEADSISAAAMRVLYTKLSSAFTKSSLKSYQVFNKLRKEEEKIYSDIKYGTFFTNLKPVLFHWSVRQAFQDNMIPVIDKDNPSFTSNICNLTRNLFPMFKDEICKYELMVKNSYLLKLNEKNSLARKTLQHETIYGLALFEFPICLMIIVAGIILNMSNTNLTENSKLIISAMLIISVVSMLLFRNITKGNRINEKNASRDKLNLQIKSLESEINLLKEQRLDK